MCRLYSTLCINILIITSTLSYEPWVNDDAARLVALRSVLPPESNVCTEQKTCGECIAASPTCSWCMQPEFDVNNGTYFTRCDDAATLTAKGCDYIVDPKHHTTLTRNEAPRDGDASRESIQLSPQEVKVAIRPKLPYSLDVTFRLADNYPVDLYYIMDLSHTMLKSKKSLASLGNQLAAEMGKITSNFRLGFGSYVDKKTSPYANIVPAMLLDPCRTTVCVPTYAFKNHLALTTEAQRFTDNVDNSQISANVDKPESTLDAIMQAVACKGEIGWRDVSRKILVVSTDSTYHYAGDGKLAGIMTPNDGLCHLDENGEYNMSLSLDYPSISHLAQRISEENINVIFAIINSKRALGDYTGLLTLIKGATAVELNDDSSNIIQIIKENYEKISGKVSLKHDAPEGVEISYSSSCLGVDQKNVSECDGLKVLDNVTLTVTFNVTECPVDPADRTKVVTIYPDGLADRLVVRLDIQCTCPCERDDFSPVGDIRPPETNSRACNWGGTFECGTCTCNPDTYGSLCECIADSDKMCKMTESSAYCEGRGSCYCGYCLCDAMSVTDPTKVYTGQYCECDDYSCDYYGGKLCGGADRGMCQCGMCQCMEGYTGMACSCSTSTDTCMGDNKRLCSGHGRCICGKCFCDQNYQGNTCDNCPSCPGHCKMNKACVQCVAFRTGPYSDADCAGNCTHITIVNELNKDDTDDTLVCKFRDEDSCDFYFTYTESTQLVHSQSTKECPEPVNKIGIIVGVICGITVIGFILLVIGKIVITIYDRKEYAKFVSERDAAKWQTEDNPLYKPSTSTFKNPTFDKKA